MLSYGLPNIILVLHKNWREWSLRIDDAVIIVPDYAYLC